MILFKLFKTTSKVVLVYFMCCTGYTSKVVPDTSFVVLCTSSVVLGTSNVVFDTSFVVLCTSYVVLGTSKVVLDNEFSYIWKENGNVSQLQIYYQSDRFQLSFLVFNFDFKYRDFIYNLCLPFAILYFLFR